MVPGDIFSWALLSAVLLLTYLALKLLSLPQALRHGSACSECENRTGSGRCLERESGSPWPCVCEFQSFCSELTS